MLNYDLCSTITPTTTTMTTMTMFARSLSTLFYSNTLHSTAIQSSYIHSSHTISLKPPSVRTSIPLPPPHQKTQPSKQISRKTLKSLPSPLLSFPSPCIHHFHPYLNTMGGCGLRAVFKRRKESSSATTGFYFVRYHAGLLRKSPVLAIKTTRDVRAYLA